MEGTGNLQKTTTVESIMNKDVLCTDVVGLVGEPFEIETTSQFDKATLTYVIDKSKLGDTEFDNLMFLWYDEDNDNFVELDTVLDEDNSTVSVETTHFSRYMIVDSKEWFAAWSEEFDYRPKEGITGLNITYDTVFAIDCSGSMSSYDNNGSASKRAEAVRSFLEIMRDGDKAGVVKFTNSATVLCELTDIQFDVIQALARISSTGNTSFKAAITKSLSLFDEDNVSALVLAL